MEKSRGEKKSANRSREESLLKTLKEKIKRLQEKESRKRKSSQSTKEESKKKEVVYVSQVPLRKSKSQSNLAKQDSVRKEKRLVRLERSYSKKLKEFKREMKRNKTMISEMRL